MKGVGPWTADYVLMDYGTGPIMAAAGLSSLVARFIDPDVGAIDKCTFCHHRVAEGLDPACVSSCPTHCMHFGSLDDPGSEVSKLLRTRKYKVLSPETGNEPNVYYLI